MRVKEKVYLKLYVDESGSITASADRKKRYFVIAYAQTSNPNNVIRQFRKAKVDFLKMQSTPTFDIKDEIKGSEMPYAMKKLIFQRLAEKTDITFHYKIIDNNNLTTNLINSPSISFNYFIGLSLKSICHSQTIQSESLFMLIDERNQSVQSLNSLEEYLKIEFTLNNTLLSDVTVKYKDSKTKDLIQIADIFANTLYRVCVSHATGNYDKRNRRLLSSCNIGCHNYFPRNKNTLDICNTTIDFLKTI